jgi:hypothetical protein
MNVSEIEQLASYMWERENKRFYPRSMKKKQKKNKIIVCKKIIHNDNIIVFYGENEENKE